MPDKAKVLVIDSGHGGLDPGAVGYAGPSPVYEKHLAWRIATCLRDEAVNSGLKVLVVPHDEPMQFPDPLRFVNRVKWAVEHGATHFISIHWNSGPPSAHGSESWYRSGDVDSRPWAMDVLNAACRSFSTAMRNVQSDAANHHGRLGILHGFAPQTLATLLEVGFITNGSDVDSGTNGKKQIAFAQEIYKLVRA